MDFLESLWMVDFNQLSIFNQHEKVRECKWSLWRFSWMIHSSPSLAWKHTHGPVLTHTLSDLCACGCTCMWCFEICGHPVRGVIASWPVWLKDREVGLNSSRAKGEKMKMGKHLIWCVLWKPRNSVCVLLPLTSMSPFVCIHTDMHLFWPVFVLTSVWWN